MVETERETDTHPVSNQRSCGAEFKLGWDKVSKLLELSHLALPPPTFSKERKKEKEEAEERVSRGRKEVNENQTHGPVWSGREQWEDDVTNLVRDFLLTFSYK